MGIPYLSHDQLHVMVEGNLASYLTDHIDDLSQEEQDCLAAIVDYNDWEAEIKCIDRKFHANYQCFLNLHSLHQTRKTPFATSQKHTSDVLEECYIPYHTVNSISISVHPVMLL